MAKSAAKFAKGAGGAGAAAAAAAASAAKAAKGAAGAAAAAAAKAAKAAGKSAGEAAAAAAKSAKKAAGSAGDLGKLGKKAGKNADSAGDLAKAGKKVGKNADSAGDLAKAGKKSSKLGKGAKKAAPLLAAAGLVGGVMYIDKKLSKESEAVQGCTTACLPSNYDQMVYGDLTKDKLKYKTLAELKKADPKTPEDQPLCNDKVSDCGKYCTDKCKEKHQSEIPGSSILSRGADAAGDVFKKINETLNPFAGPEGKKRMIIAGVILFLILFGPLVFKMMF
mgnify:CR=1 FL=1